MLSVGCYYCRFHFFSLFISFSLIRIFIVDFDAYSSSNSIVLATCFSVWFCQFSLCLASLRIALHCNGFERTTKSGNKGTCRMDIEFTCMFSRFSCLFALIASHFTLMWFNRWHFCWWKRFSNCLFNKKKFKSETMLTAQQCNVIYIFLVTAVASQNIK